jgi:hypothetical protein
MSLISLVSDFLFRLSEDPHHSAFFQITIKKAHFHKGAYEAGNLGKPLRGVKNGRQGIHLYGTYVRVGGIQFMWVLLSKLPVELFTPAEGL